MPAPRLLDKKLIQASLATERKQEIDKGLKLAKSIEALREAKATEERELEELREHALKSVQIQIDLKAAENERYSQENKRLKEERVRLEGPIDLVQAWDEVHTLKEHNESISENLLKREVNVLTRENNVYETLASFKGREQEITQSEVVASQNLRQSEEQREEAARINNEAQTVLTNLELQSAEQNALLRKRDEELERREAAALLKEEQIEMDRVEIIREKVLLADRRATLERGFAELRRKQT